MIEAGWLEATDPVPMLECLRGKASVRKLRLFGLACCRYPATESGWTSTTASCSYCVVPTVMWPCPGSPR